VIHNIVRSYLICKMIAALGGLCFGLLLVVCIVSCQETFLDVYPSESDPRKEIYFGLTVSFGGDQTTVGAIPGVRMAVDDINNRADILPGYILRYTLTDSQVIIHHCAKY